VSKQGLEIIGVYGIFMGEFYLGLLILWAILITLGGFVIGPRVVRLIKRVREPIILAFSTASSEAAYPKTLEELERFGCSNRVASFVLPLGYSFNLDGSMMYCTFAVMFIAQVYGIELSIGQQIMMLAILMLTSKGIAGVPRASLVVIAATLGQFGIPETGLLLLLGVDHFLDMGRSATNVIGNSIATAVVSKWEGELRTEDEVAAQAVPAKL
jgi:Na+/H+-dicarboxylate symporter